MDCNTVVINARGSGCRLSQPLIPFNINDYSSLRLVANFNNHNRIHNKNIEIPRVEVRTKQYAEINVIKELELLNNVISFKIHAADVTQYDELKVTYRPILDDPLQTRIFQTIRVRILR